MNSDLKDLPKLKPAIKKRWLKALRSGKYEQTQGYLNIKGHMCCLGVLCDVVKNDKPIDLAWRPEYDETSSFDGATRSLPTLVVNHAFVAAADVLHSHLVPLTERNDGSSRTRPQSFKQIANIIERHM